MWVPDIPVDKPCRRPVGGLKTATPEFATYTKRRRLRMTSALHLQCLLGLQCRDFVMVAADQTNTQSIIVMKNDMNKIHEIADGLLMGAVGEPGDVGQFSQFVSKNLQLYTMRNGYRLDTTAAVHFTRKNLADGLRGGTPTMLNMLIAGYDGIEGSQLYSLDFLAACIKVPFAAHGFGGLLSLGILDQCHKYTLTEAEAYEVMKACVREIHQRLFVSLPNFQVKVVSSSGIKELPIITSASMTK